MQATPLMEIRGSGPNAGRFMHSAHCGLTDQHSQAHRQVFTCVSGSRRSSLQVAAVIFGEDSLFPGEAGSTELKFVLVHLRLTASWQWQANKGFFVRRRAAQQNPHKGSRRCSAGREEEKELVESRGAAEAGGQEKNTINEEGRRRRRRSKSGCGCASVSRSECGESRPMLGYSRETDLWTGAERDGSCVGPVRTDGQRCWEAGMSHYQAEGAVEQLERGRDLGAVSCRERK